MFWMACLIVASMSSCENPATTSAVAPVGITRDCVMQPVRQASAAPNRGIYIFAFMFKVLLLLFSV